ncbi:hypothetical protein COT97_03870 [Candidatus Falkowbacteria bacterium CG10_big_fil_rev_8_21_14_0_10_39_11]|uniref:Uncharacterized protein n=1 Tax=Candidatus Falkowbacteria bacterium CG10_big_fil_rev_8_21_14_0_10_39_11 TaxID=1974565 RepID=A0A2H0V4E3_9BACT|nr:MAG: hypothetical protein COT97_03870 [Candidatus Falkowbacteria bacterium CG10_big_fil_rev_8_21_14_0_10_39_11]
MAPSLAVEENRIMVNVLAEQCDYPSDWDRLQEARFINSEILQQVPTKDGFVLILCLHPRHHDNQIVYQIESDLNLLDWHFDPENKSHPEVHVESEIAWVPKDVWRRWQRNYRARLKRLMASDKIIFIKSKVRFHEMLDMLQMTVWHSRRGYQVYPGKNFSFIVGGHGKDFQSIMIPTSLIKFMATYFPE